MPLINSTQMGHRHPVVRGTPIAKCLSASERNDEHSIQDPFGLGPTFCSVLTSLKCKSSCSDPGTIHMRAAKCHRVTICNRDKRFRL